MKIMKRLTLIISLILVLFSCGNDTQFYSKYKELSKGGVWDKSEELFFKVNIKDISKRYDVRFAFRHLVGFAYKDLKIKVTELSPSKKETVSEYSLKIVDENGDYLGGEAMSIIDCENMVEIKKSFSEKGTYIFKVEHLMDVSSIEYALELGLIITESEPN
jgi:gliding motility-associated lipoprotein GldH